MISLLTEIVIVESDLLPELIEEIMIHLRSGVIILGTQADGRCQLMIKISSDLTQKGILAGQLIKEIAPEIEGSGGGKAESAQAGGKKPEGLHQAFDKARQWLATK